MLYRIAIRGLRILLYFIMPMRVIGREKLLYNKGVLMAANHQSFWDPIFIAMAYKEPMRFMAKKELFKFKPFGALLGALGAFPVDRGHADLKAVKKALGILKSNAPLLLFPEGTRVQAGEQADIKHGVAMFALKTKSPIQPIALVGSFKPFCTTYVVIGDAIYYEEYFDAKLDNELLGIVSDDVVDRIRKIAEDAKKGLAK